MDRGSCVLTRRQPAAYLMDRGTCQSHGPGGFQADLDLAARHSFNHGPGEYSPLWTGGLFVFIDRGTSLGLGQRRAHNRSWTGGLSSDPGVSQGTWQYGLKGMDWGTSGQT